MRGPLMAAAASLALTACAVSDLVGTEPPRGDPPSGDPTVRIPARRPATPAPPESVALAERYRETEARLVSDGRLRTDGDALDATVDAARLAESFLEVAFFDEYIAGPRGLVAQTRPTGLRRWRDPVRIGLVFGASVDDDARRRDRRARDALAARLAATTGHDVAPASDEGNFTVYVMREDERRALLPRLALREADLTPTVVAVLDRMPASQFCLVVGFYDDAEPAVLRRAMAFIRAEHPPLLRLSCFHEELAQGLGLTNDSPAARPSIFNDDEEFALLTRMDEMMLGMLYDPRLSAGMTMQEAAPLVMLLAAEAVARSDIAQDIGRSDAEQEAAVAGAATAGEEG